MKILKKKLMTNSNPCKFLKKAYKYCFMILAKNNIREKKIKSSYAF